MRSLIFAKRNFKEILRDPLNIIFGIGFPIVVLLLLTAIQANVPVPLFEIDRVTPGITIFGLSFMTLFSATLISKDRQSAFLERLYTTPMTPFDFIIGYTIPILPLSILQCALTYVVGFILGLTPSLNILLAILAIIPISLVYIALGLLCGSLLNDKQVGGICGALLTNLSAWLSGIWFDIELIGGVFTKIANLLPFIHSVELERAIVSGDFGGMLPHILWVLGYGILLLLLSVFTFLHQMRKK